MAEGVPNAFGQRKIEVYGAGSYPSSTIDHLMIEVMKKKEFDLSSKWLKSLNELPTTEMDYLVGIGLRTR